MININKIIYITKICKICKGTGKVLKDIPDFDVPDIKNCSFNEKCKNCDGTGYIKKTRKRNCKYEEKIEIPIQELNTKLKLNKIYHKLENLEKVL